jgi:hypothetical protein
MTTLVRLSTIGSEEAVGDDPPPIIHEETFVDPSRVVLAQPLNFFGVSATMLYFDVIALDGAPLFVRAEGTPEAVFERLGIEVR